MPVSSLLAALLLALPPGAQQASPKEPEVVDRPLAESQLELLELAFAAATAMPLHPHVKERSRAQEEVVVVALALGQPQRALRYGEQIADWRRGAAYADLAYHCAQLGARRPAEAHLARALAEAQRPEEELGQSWRRDYILAKVARAQLALGVEEQAVQLASSLQAAHGDALGVALARRGDAAAFDRHLETVPHLAATGDLDQIRVALRVCADGFDRFYADTERRQRAEAALRASWSKLPLALHVEFLDRMCAAAQAHGDLEHARQLAADAERVLEQYAWTVEHRLPLMARVAAMRHRAGDPQGAAQLATAAEALFDARGGEIPDLYRGRTLRPLAEAYQKMGQPAAALAVYRRAVEEGARNPNARPRALDLVATCLSLAQHAVEPGEAMLAHLRRIGAALGDPW